MTHPAFQAGNGAVVTGAALGIGRALSQHFADLGMKVAMLDVDAGRLREATDAVGANALPLVCDVSQTADWDNVRRTLEGAWGVPPSVLVNNAVTRTGRGFDADPEDWRRAIDINIMGVVNGVRCFRDAMESSGRPGLIINVGSKQGITNPPGHPVYNLTKAAVKSYTESLEHDLRQAPDRAVSAHLLVPGWTTTGTAEHKPGAWLPDQVVDHMMAALDRGSFYIICPDGEVSTEMDKRRILWAAGDITEDRVALSRWHETGKAAFKDR